MSSKYDQQFADIKRQITGIEGTMRGVVTKDYLDEKLNDLRSDMGLAVRKGNAKVDTLTEILHTRKVISSNDQSRIVSLSPFGK